MRRALVTALAVLAIAGAAVLDVMVPAQDRVPAAATVSTRAGVLACPIATIDRGKAYLHIANVGGSDSSMRITLFPVKGKRVTFAEELAPGVARTIAVHSKVSGASSALIEHSGGIVVASHSLWVPPERGLPSGGSAGACMPSTSTQVVVAPTRTLGTETTLTLFNPGAADAVVSVVLLMPDRKAAPERLTGRIVPAHSRRDFTLGSFAFDEREVLAIVDASSGRVVPEALVTSVSRGMELIGGQAPAEGLTLAYFEGGSGSSRSYAAIGSEDTGVSVRALGSEGFSGEAADSAVLPTALTRGSGPPEAKIGGFVVRRTSGSLIAGGATWLHQRSAGNDLASLEGLSPSNRWAAVIGSVVDSSDTVALIVNPGDVAARVSATARGPAGETRSNPTLPPGAIGRIMMAHGKGSFSMLVEADQPVTVYLVQVTRAYPRTAQIFDLPAISLRPPLPVAARPDRRTGIPAKTQR